MFIDFLSDQPEFSERLDSALSFSGRTQKELAEEIGVTPQMISQYVNGKSHPSFSLLTSMARKLGVSTDYLLGLSDCPIADIEIGNISDSTGLTVKSIQNLQKYKDVPLFIEVVNFLLTDLKLLESLADYLTVPLLKYGYNKVYYDKIIFSLPSDAQLSRLKALELLDCAASAQKALTEDDVFQLADLADYVLNRFIASYAIGIRSPESPESVSSDGNVSCSKNKYYTRFEWLIQEIEHFGISNLDYVKNIKSAVDHI